MFSWLGKLVARHWVVVLLAWVAAVGGLKIGQRFDLLPRWNDVTRDGDLAHLPSQVTSRRGTQLLRTAFPDDLAKSQIVVVVAREEERLTAADLALTGRLADAFRSKIGELPILDVWTYRTEVVGRKLRSSDRRAVLIVLQLSNELMATDNIRVLAAVQQLLDAELTDAPTGLDVGVTGSAAIGGDMLTAAAESIRNTETFAILLVVMILLAVYRAPLLVAVPLISIVASISVGTDLVAWLAQDAGRVMPSGWELRVFKTTRIFVVVILYGAGTDYCLFLTSRYREELARGLSRSDAVARGLGRVGHALAASALTTIVGLAMMGFADFGKFSSSGPVIATCLAVTLLACITLAPALLQAFGDLVFWPFGPPLPPAQRAAATGRGPGRLINGLWETLSGAILARPGLILIASLLLFLPLAYQGWSVDVTYDLLSELSRDRPSVRGTALLQRYFPRGETGPLTVLACRPDSNFDTKEGRRRIAELTKMLYEIDGVTSVRSIAEPLGDAPGSVQPFTKAGLAKLAARSHPLTRARFVAQGVELEGHVARFEVILADDPFSAAAIERLNSIDRVLTQLPTIVPYWHPVTFELIGTTAGIRDLKRVTESDRRLIEQLVVVAVLAVLLVLLRRPLICVYLIVSVLLSYLVTIGLTEFFFRWLYGDTFTGIDWKVPLFLFVIMIAVGQDYNIYLATRIFEDQRRLGLREGLRTAIMKTGGIITSCGVIMAGTFFSMMTGSLRGMLELGFALTLGILLDTFVVRTILVPAFFALLIPWQTARGKRPAVALEEDRQTAVERPRPRESWAGSGRL
jgi:RND superfamily putative drug exporter